MSTDDILRDIELPDAMTPEERLKRIARLILKAIRIRQARQAKAAEHTHAAKQKEGA